MKLSYKKVPLNRYTFKIKAIRDWVEDKCVGMTLNLFAGKTKLLVNEVRNDIDENMEADYHQDALDFLLEWNNDFDVVILDPPYSYRKSMEMYNGKIASRFKQLKNVIARKQKVGGKVITFGYHSVSMGKGRGYEQEEILLMSHGGAIHDTIAVVETLKGKK